jgi:hypothetical protein
MCVVSEMGVDDAQRKFFELGGSRNEQRMRWVAPFVDKGDDVLFLDYERIIVW